MKEDADMTDIEEIIAADKKREEKYQKYRKIRQQEEAEKYRKKK